MARVIAGMTVSVDGFVNDRNGSVDALYPDLEALRETPSLQKLIRSTGAVVMGRNAFAMADDPDWFAGNYEFQVPIFVLTHHPPARQPEQTDSLNFTFVSDGIESAIRQAKATAGDKVVTVIGGADTLRQCLRAGLVDELHIDVMPVLLGGGLRLFEGFNAHIELEQIDAVELLPSGRTQIRYNVLK